MRGWLVFGGSFLTFLVGVSSPVTWTRAGTDSSLGPGLSTHLTLEASLDLLWFLLSVGVFVHWAARGCGRRVSRLPGIVVLAFTLALLFPVISADDDLTQLDLINDAATSESITAALKSVKHLAGSTGLPSLPAVSASRSDVCLPVTSELVAESSRTPRVTTPGDVTGNHSPPLC